MCFKEIITGFRKDSRSGRVGVGTKYVPGPVDLHELPEISVQAGDGQGIQQGLANGKQALFPVPAVLADDIFHIVFIDQQVFGQDGLGRCSTADVFQNFLLVFKGDL